MKPTSIYRDGPVTMYDEARAPEVLPTMSFMHQMEPSWHLRIGIYHDGGVVQVDWSNSILSGAFSTPPTVAKVKQWLADAANILGE